MILIFFSYSRRSGSFSSIDFWILRIPLNCEDTGEEITLSEYKEATYCLMYAASLFGTMTSVYCLRAGIPPLMYSLVGSISGIKRSIFSFSMITGILS